MFAEGGQELSRIKLKLQDAMANQTLSDDLNKTLQVSFGLFILFSSVLCCCLTLTIRCLLCLVVYILANVVDLNAIDLAV